MIRVFAGAIVTWLLAGAVVFAAIDVLMSHYLGRASWLATVLGL